MSNKYQVLKVNDIDDVIIEIVRTEGDYQDIQDIIVKFPPGRGYNPETISLIDAGLINISGEYEINNWINDKGRTILPRVNLVMYGSISEVRVPKKEEIDDAD